MLGRTACQARECMDDRGIPIRSDGTTECRSCGAPHAVTIDADGGHTDVHVELIQEEAA